MFYIISLCIFASGVDLKPQVSFKCSQKHPLTIKPNNMDTHKATHHIWTLLNWIKISDIQERTAGWQTKQSMDDWATVQPWLSKTCKDASFRWELKHLQTPTGKHSHINNMHHAIAAHTFQVTMSSTGRGSYTGNAHPGEINKQEGQKVCILITFFFFFWFLKAFYWN